MKVFIDHYYEQERFVEILSARLKSIKNGISVVAFKEISALASSQTSELITIAHMKDADIIIPIITSTYLGSGETQSLSSILESISEDKNKYLFPIIFSPANWSSISWVVKSKVFPEDGMPMSELSIYEQEKNINKLVQTIENVVVANKNAKVEVQKSNQEIINNLNTSMVFISHSHEDSDFAELLNLQLEKKGVVGWIDSERLRVGQDWRQEIDDSISNSIAVIAIMTPEARNSEYVTYEWAYAWGKGKKIFPIMLKQSPLHPRLESLQYLDFTNRLTRPWDKLIDSILKLQV